MEAGTWGLGGIRIAVHEDEARKRYALGFFEPGCFDKKVVTKGVRGCGAKRRVRF